MQQFLAHFLGCFDLLGRRDGQMAMTRGARSRPGITDHVDLHQELDALAAEVRADDPFRLSRGAGRVRRPCIAP
jgi:hypothetical protein